MTHMQGIVSILRSDTTTTTTTASAAPLRRTLSADMSSKKWLTDNGLPVIKKIPSSEQIAIDSSSSSDSDEDECEVVGKGDRNPTRVDIWTAIMSQKKQDDSSKLPPPYVHPLVKKSASSLSEKSLKVCTESLGSESGSDVLFSDDRKEEDHKMVKLACFAAKKAPPARSLPPPLPSLAAARADGPSVHMHSRRVDGRLVVEAVTVHQQKYLEAQRHDGRFLLTLVNDPEEEEERQPPAASDEHAKGVDEKEYGGEMETDKERDMGILKERATTTTRVINVYKSTVAMFERDNENPSWSRKVAEEVEEAPAVRSRGMGLPPLPPPASTTVNSYQYFWRAKPTVASVISQQRPPTKTKDVVLLRGNIRADCILPSLKGCKEPRRSLLMWEPFCIATS